MGRNTPTGTVPGYRAQTGAEHTRPDGERNGRQRAGATAATRELGGVTGAASDALVRAARRRRRRGARHPGLGVDGVDLGEERVVDGVDGAGRGAQRARRAGAG
ncbi:hypothetical protein DLE60_15005, partial [Micromonospora globispora]